MASYPNSVKTFTTKNAGDIVQPADINDPQDEINAMQDGLLNGTARLNSSNSTMVHLSVTAGMEVVGNSTLGSTVTIGGIPYQFPSTAPSSGHVLVCASTGTPNVLSWRGNVSAMNLVATSDSESTTTSSAATTLKTISGLSIAATSWVKVIWTTRKSSAASADQMRMRVQINGQVHSAVSVVTASSTGAVVGFGSIEISPRDANNPASLFGTHAVNEGGAQNLQILVPTGLASTVTGTISEIKLDGYNVNGLAECRVGNVKVYEMTGA